ncbi:MAG: hypothetical protein ACYSWP_13555 [Planctomycetota bacterium]
MASRIQCLQYYGSAGPTMLLSPSTELEISLTAGVHIPMKSHRRYNVTLAGHPLRKLPHNATPARTRKD